MIDTGIRSSHNEYKDVSGNSRVKEVVSVIYSVPSGEDGNGHGSHCMGLPLV